METTFKSSYIEVGKILNILGESYKKQLPEKVMQLFEVNQDYDNMLNIDEVMNIENLNISRNALVILSILNLKYWEKDEAKKEALKKQYYDNEIKFQEKINVYKNDDWLKNRTNVQEKENVENNAEATLILQKDLSIFAKIKNFIIQLFHSKG